MVGIVITLLVLWAVFAVLGFAIKGLLWLAIIGILLFIATAIWGWMRRNV
jgi:hypothetical protein